MPFKFRFAGFVRGFVQRLHFYKTASYLIDNQLFILRIQYLALNVYIRHPLFLPVNNWRTLRIV
jgi:hypothetical protein